MSVNRLLDVIEQFKGKRIFVMGDLMVDHYIFGESNRLSPEAPVPVVDVASELFKPGGAANVISNILSLGGEVSTAGIVGDDKNGSWLINELRNRGVDVTGIITDKKRSTTTKTRILVGHHQLVRVDYESREEISQEWTKKIISHIRDNVDQVENIVVSDYDKGFVTANLIGELVNLQNKKDKKIIVDPKIAHFLDYKGVSIIKTNIKNACKALGMSMGGNTTTLEMASKILSQLGCEAIIITLGKEGMFLLEGDGNHVRIPALARPVFDVTGAGDTVSAALTLSLSTQASILEAVMISNVAAGIKIGKIGTAVVTRDELIKQLEESRKVR